MTRQKTPSYEEKLQLNALGWLHRNKSKYSNDNRLCAAAVQFLADSFDASQQSAENAVLHAYGELRHLGQTCYLDTQLSSSSIAVIRDNSTGMLYPIPVGCIFEQLIKPHVRPALRLIDNKLH